MHKLNLDYNLQLASGREQIKRAQTPLLSGNGSMIGLNKKKLIMSKVHVDDSKVRSFDLHLA